MIEYKDVMPVGFLKKLPFYGSYHGMRYRLEIKEDGMQVSVWPGPLGFESVDPSLVEEKTFSPDEDGRRAAIDYLNEYYNLGKRVWKEGL